MPLDHPTRRSQDQSSVGWISNTDAVMFGMVVFFVVAVFLDAKHRLRPSADAEWERQLAAITAKLEEVERRLATAVSDLEATRARGANWQRDAEAAAERLKVLLAEQARLETTLAVLCSENDDLKKIEKALQQRLSNGSKGYHELQEKYKAEKESNKEHLAELKALTEQADDLRRQANLFAEENVVILAAYLETESRLQQAESSENRVRRELIGLKGRDGKLNRVVIVFDASLSMKQGGRWEKARLVMEEWLKWLDIGSGALVVFSTGVASYPSDGSLLSLTGSGSIKNRDELCRFLEGVEPEGGTNTLAALQKAYAYADLDAILLFTDGAPNDGHGSVFDPKVAERIYSLCKSRPDIPINAVGLGDYFKPELSQFLLRIAEMTGGTFVGR